MPEFKDTSQPSLQQYPFESVFESVTFRVHQDNFRRQILCEVENAYHQRFDRHFSYVKIVSFILTVIIPLLILMAGYNFFSQRENNELVKDMEKFMATLKNSSETELQNLKNNGHTQITELKNEGERIKLLKEGYQNSAKELENLNKERSDLLRDTKELLLLDQKNIESQFQEIRSRFKDLETQQTQILEALHKKQEEINLVLDKISNYGDTLEKRDTGYSNQLKSLHKQLDILTQIIKGHERDIKKIQFKMPQ